MKFESTTGCISAYHGLIVIFCYFVANCGDIYSVSASLS